MAEVLACQIVILDGTTISQDVNVSICLSIPHAYKSASFSAADHCKYAALLFAEESCRPSAAKPRIQTPRTR